MDNASVLAGFRQFTPESIRAAMTHCQANVAEADLCCREVLRACADNPGLLTEEAARHELSCALLYLSYRRDQLAGPDLLRLVSQAEFSQPLAETDWLVRNLHRFLAALLDPGEITAISALILNHNLATEVREQALLTYPFRLQENAIEEKLVVDEYRRLLTTAIGKKRQDDPRLWMAAAINAAVIGGNKLRLLLNTVLDSGLLQDQTTFSRRIISGIFQIGSQHFRDVFRKEHRGHLVDIDAEIDGLFAPPEAPAAELPERGEPKTRTEPKIGRNDPCPCGSGKKHKKCCGA
ncbi:MAG TPA: DUF1186 domain-containing protein [Lentisphaeria bacterium]|nr:DUF1186 domain-containing protein [Lentisphaeria bacterium]